MAFSRDLGTNMNKRYPKMRLCFATRFLAGLTDADYNSGQISKNAQGIADMSWREFKEHLFIADRVIGPSATRVSQPAQPVLQATAAVCPPTAMPASMPAAALYTAASPPLPGAYCLGARDRPPPLFP